MEVSFKMAFALMMRDSAKDVVNYIGYNKMYQDGICEVEEGMFSSSIAFDDTSYHSVRDEQQKAMFSAITRLYDQFGADTLVQMSVINTPLLKEEVGHRKFFDPERQANDAARNDAQVFNNILNDKVKEGVSNIRRNRYLTYSVTADTAEDAARQLSRIEVESSRILNSIGSKAHLMNGTQRLSVIHSLLNPYKPFLFDYQRDISAKRLQTTKDCIAPTQIDFRPDGHYNDCVKLDNGVYAQVLVMKKFGSELSDRALADMADLPIPMAITWYVQPMDKSKAINYVRTRSAWIDKEIIEEQRSAVNKGYDFSILPQELKYSKEETEDECPKMSFWKTLSFKQTWAFAFGKFMTDGVWWFFLFWAPAYISDVYGFSSDTPTAQMLIFVLYAITMLSVYGGKLPTIIINKTGKNPYAARMQAMFIFALFPLLALFAQPLGNKEVFGEQAYWFPIIIIGIAGAAHQSWSANIYSVVGDMFPKSTIATIVGIGGMAGGISSFLINMSSGLLFDYADKTQMVFLGFQGKPAGYFIIFCVCAVSYLIGWCIMKALVPKYKPIIVD